MFQTNCVPACPTLNITNKVGLLGFIELSEAQATLKVCKVGYTGTQKKYVCYT